MADRSDLHGWLGDIALALAAAVVMLLGTAGVSEAGSPPDVAGWVLQAASAAVLVVRRRWPISVMVATITLGLAYTATGSPGGFYTVAIAVGIYTVAAAQHRRAALVGLIGGFALFLLTDLVWTTGHLTAGGGALWFLGWLGVALLLGEVARSRSDYIDAVEERAAQAERSRQEEALRRAGEERMEIARDLHDVLAHSISIMNVQAGAALHHLEHAPDRSREAMVTVRETGKRAIAELRSSIEVLRQGEGSEFSDAPVGPAPGLSDIPSLVESTRLTGLDVDLDRRGDSEVPAPVGLAAYRIVQESLTNVTRHAEATRATVTVDCGPDRLEVCIDDDGRGAPGGSFEGHGIHGMRERARALDGTLVTGPGPDGGFRVLATFPMRELL